MPSAAQRRATCFAAEAGGTGTARSTSRSPTLPRSRIDVSGAPPAGVRTTRPVRRPPPASRPSSGATRRSAPASSDDVRDRREIAGMRELQGEPMRRRRRARLATQPPCARRAPRTAIAVDVVAEEHGIERGRARGSRRVRRERRRVGLAPRGLAVADVDDLGDRLRIVGVRGRRRACPRGAARRRDRSRRRARSQSRKCSAAACAPPSPGRSLVVLRHADVRRRRG